ncbi:translation initiation factor IF-2 [Streptomyces sp. NPDC004959]|uniref:hypothetical protein n=1 Tax=unclassified Streptomyces TaxID=2593676 RepID=UPI0004C83132|nr:hypothetical protein [Streptomyces sp. NRRL F-5630]
MTATLPDGKTTTTRTGDHTTSFLPSGARERLEPRLREAVSEFVDSPAEAVEKADRLLAETVEQLHEALVHRRGELRSAWDGKGDAGSARNAESARREDGAGFGDGTPGGAGTGLGGDRADLASDRADLVSDRADLGGDRIDPSGPRDRTGTVRDADRDGVAEDRTGLSGASDTRRPGATSGAEADTERLRLALQEYRETTERLLNL